MATIAENLQRIKTAKSDIRTAIINKGVDVPSGDTIDTYADKITDITTPIKTNYVVINNYGITILQMPDVFTSYTFNGGQIPCSMFENCQKLSNFIWNIPESSIDNAVIEQYAFYGTTMKSFPFPNRIHKIGQQAFGNSKIEGNIKASISSIEFGAFIYCSGLTSIDISHITSIGNSAFNGCTSLTSITVRGSSSAAHFTTIEENTFDDTNNCPIYVPADKVEELKTASGWSAYADRLQPIAE